MNEKQKLEIGDIVDDLKCIGKERDYSFKYPTYKYIMQCTKCGRTKNMLSSTIRRHSGTTHEACGKGLKLKSNVFYSRWTAMRTRTTNPNYQGTKYYLEKGIDSDEFKYFIDFYDKMYLSFKELADVIGENNVSLERIDNSKPYSVENCIWIDKHNQPKNTSAIVDFEVIYPDGHTEIHKNIREFAIVNNLNDGVIRDCLNPKRPAKSYKGLKFRKL